jgi:hypothetical protein
MPHCLWQWAGFGFENFRAVVPIIYLHTYPTYPYQLLEVYSMSLSR